MHISNLKVPKKLFYTLLAIMLLVGVSGCELMDSGSEKTISSSLVDYLYPDDSKSMTKDKGAGLSSLQINLPARVGIAFVPGTDDWRTSAVSQQKQTELLLKAKEKFSSYEFIDHIEIIPSSYLKNGGGFTNLQQVARLHGVDLMALVSYDQVQKKFTRDSSFFYLTIIGAYIVKGDSNEAHTFVDTAVFDVRSKKLLFRAPGTNSLEKRSTAIDKERVQTGLASDGMELAMEEMIINLDQELGEFKQRVMIGKIAHVNYREGYSGGGGGVSVFLLLFILLFRSGAFIRVWK